METQSQDSAFGFAATLPNEEAIYNHGLTKRELFAAMAMQGLVNAQYYTLGNGELEAMSERAVYLADTLIKELNKTNKQQ